MRRLVTTMIAAALCTGQAAAQAMDPINPTCPAQPNWSDYRSMQFSVAKERDTAGVELNVLKGEGAIDASTPTKLQAMLDEHGETLDEIWLRSPGGDAEAGTQAGYIIRQSTIPTRIPSGWTCFSACNFMFMGGYGRIVDPGGVFMVHMFTHTANREAIRKGLAGGEDRAVGLIADIEQSSAILAAEDADFLVRMGVVSRLLTEVMYRQAAVAGRGDAASTRRCLSQAEIFEYNVARPIKFEG